MKTEIFTTEQDGFRGAYYPCGHDTKSAFILMLAMNTKGLIINAASRMLHKRGCDVIAISPDPPGEGFVDFPIENFRKAADVLKKRGMERIGAAGGSATAAMVLIAASRCPEITMTLAMTPCDFVMEGYIRDKKDGAGERPADGHSMASWEGEPLPFLPFAYRHPDYWKKIREESKETGNVIASKRLFERSEELHPLTDDQFIKVEDIRGTVILAGGEDDCLWDTAKYIRRMEERIRRSGSPCRLVSRIYTHSTHFICPDDMLKDTLHILSGLPVMLFREGRRNRKACRESRRNLEKILDREIALWKEK